jgi:1-pyrroline-5-carboxylate dehydrogenase
MTNAITHIPQPVNEPARSYEPGSPEKASLKARLEAMLDEKVDIPIIIGGREVRTANTIEVVSPHDHQHVLGQAHKAGADEVDAAIAASQEAWKEWSEVDWQDRAAVILKAADLLAGPWRDTINAATMLNQSKTVYQAEIDAATELIDFWRFNAHYVERIYSEQPISSPGMWNQIEYRALEGFVFAVTPFNFTAIGGNLPTAPALMGCVALWKPASTALLPAYYLMKLYEEAGLPPGVINFLPGRGANVGDPALASPLLAGVHFTGSTAVFQSMWRTIGDNIANYKSYPRIVGETGGKDFIFAHPSADVDALVVALVRGAFEYQGQKCSAASRAFIPRSLWDDVRAGMESTLAGVKMGSPLDFTNFMAAVIDEASFDNITGYIEQARNSDDMEVIIGGGSSNSVGYFVEPTVVLSDTATSPLMCDEIFGPVLTIHVYEDDSFEETLELADTATPYALTGAVFAQDRTALVHMGSALRHAAGNFYINDKPTGAVVGQQPFGGGRASGTNDKAGSMANLLRWTSQRTIKETFVPPTDHTYPHMDEE